MTYRLGLTGSIAMGKSTTAALFAAEGVPVWDADATVHRLYAAGGAAIPALSALFPDVIDLGAVSRPALRARLAADPAALDRLQAVIHPLVAADRARFVAAASAPIILLDIPLLFETGAERDCDGVVVVTAAPQVQRDRLLSRGQMTAAEVAMLLARQMPDADKQARATWVIDTTTLDAARAAVRMILATIRKGQPDA